MSQDPLQPISKFDVSKYREARQMYRLVIAGYAVFASALLYVAADDRMRREEHVQELTELYQERYPKQEGIPKRVQNSIDSLIGLEALLGWGALEGALWTRRRQKKMDDQYKQYQAWRSQFVRKK